MQAAAICGYNFGDAQTVCHSEDSQLPVHKNSTFYERQLTSQFSFTSTLVAYSLLL